LIDLSARLERPPIFGIEQRPLRDIALQRRMTIAVCVAVRALCGPRIRGWCRLSAASRSRCFGCFPTRAGARSAASYPLRAFPRIRATAAPRGSPLRRSRRHAFLDAPRTGRLRSVASASVAALSRVQQPRARTTLNRPWISRSDTTTPRGNVPRGAESDTVVSRRMNATARAYAASAPGRPVSRLVIPNFAIR
jgi:hypothetical protein